MLQAIKNFLKRILPPPTRTLLRETESLRAKIEATGQLLETLRREQAEQAHANAQQVIFFLGEHAKQLSAALNQNHAQLQTFLETNHIALHGQNAMLQERLQHAEIDCKDTITHLAHDIQSLEQSLDQKKVFWTNNVEKRVVLVNWGDVINTPDFEKKFLALVHNLDPKSVQTIIQILLRQNRFLNCNHPQQDLFTRAEQEQLRLLKENFDDQILKISDHLFAYRNYLLPTHQFEASVFYYRHGLNDLTTLDSVKGKSIIDVGGFIGDSVLVLSELGADSIYTFEAEPKNFALLQKTLALNNLQNVIAENVALGAEAGTVTLHTSGSSTTSIDRPGLCYTGEIQVPVIALDDYVEKHGISVGLIKVDIEGGEPAFLAGAKKTICEQKPILLLSIYHNAHDFFELKPLIESWNLGYTFKIHKPIIPSTSGETLLLAEIIN